MPGHHGARTRSLGWSQRLPALLKRLSRPEPPPGSQMPPERASRVGRARQSRPWKNELSLKSRLRSVEHVKEHHHAEATKRVDERREERDRRNQATQQIEQVEDGIPHQKSRHQNRPDQCQQCRVFECHGRSMNVASDSRNSGSSHLGFDNELVARFPYGAVRGQSLKSVPDRPGRNAGGRSRGDIIANEHRQIVVLLGRPVAD